jgi:VWFA-related protein
LLAAALRSARPRGATALYNAIYGSLQELDRQRREGELRRLAVVVLSDGTDTASVITDDQVRELARRKEIGVYGVALRSPDQDAVQPDRLNPGLATFFMAALTRETGGQAHFVRSVADLRHVYDRVAEELRSQYAMGYVSSNPRHDGKWRRIVLRTPTRPGLHVRHRIGYYAPPS